MTDLATETRAPGTGHNRGPLPIGRELSDTLIDENQAIVDRCNDLLAREIMTVDDEISAKAASDYVEEIKKERKKVEAKRVDVKEPYLEGSRRVDGFFRSILDPLDGLQVRVEQQRLRGYLRKKADEERRAREEAERIAREEAARKQREAAEAAARLKSEEDLKRAIAAEAEAQTATVEHQRAIKSAAAPVAELARTRSDDGALATLRTFWTFKDMNRREIDLEALRPYLALADIEKAVRALIKSGGRELKGVVIFQDQSAMVR